MTFASSRSALFVLILFTSVIAINVRAQGTIGVSPNVLAGQPTSITVSGAGDPEPWCGFRLEFGDGNGQDVKVETRKPLPMRFAYTYAQAGDYVVSIFGKRVTNHYPCSLKAQTNLKVAAPAPMTSGATPRGASENSQTAHAYGANCRSIVTVKSATGQDVSFNLHGMISDAGGVANAKEQLSRRVIDAQSKALDETQNVNDRGTSRAFAHSLLQLRSHLEECR